MEEKHIMLAVDVVLLTAKGRVVLIKRKYKPFKGMWAVPGGFVEYGETVEAAAVREAKEETGLDIKLEKLVGVYSDPNRDPRGHLVSVCFLGRARSGKIGLTNETTGIKEYSPDEINKIDIASNHKQMIKDAGVI